MGMVRVAATQMACTWDRAANVAKAEALVREAAAQGANIVLLQELFETPYFPQEMKAEHMALAAPADGNPLLRRMSALAAELGVVLPVSFFERANNALFNALAMIDADGSCLGVYRKSHIPHAPCYEEKYYFSPGDTGFRVWRTKVATIGAGICWDQWFPEAARVMALRGADLLFYPTAIGNDPLDREGASSGAWQRVMQGHAAANVVGVVASNRVGVERVNGSAMEFYGSSFIADGTGDKIAEMDRASEGVSVAAFDLDALRRHRDRWCYFRDRRPDLYGALLTKDGVVAIGA
ncbi:MAG: N-carbamoylputrescine amidase [Alphaproteobacteria bacterium]|nr:N-carbamoylputrescine amidase [Alphaproteobacteria bacterium]